MSLEPHQHAALAEFDRLHRENQKFIEQATADLLAHGIDIRPALSEPDSQKGGAVSKDQNLLTA